jgi:hypothetical protein
MRTLLLLVSTLFYVGPALADTAATFPAPLHAPPRLLATAADFARLRAQSKTDPVSTRLAAALRQRADYFLDQPPLTRTLPLHERSSCSTYADRCEESETPYLLDPTKQADVALLAFNEEGNAIPAPDTEDWEQERVKASIERLKLNDHDALPQERRRVWQTVTEAIEGYFDAKSKYRPGINPVPAEKMAEKLRQIKALTKENAELSTVALWCVRFRNDPKLLRLVS